jgi:hypothetical protein
MTRHAFLVGEIIDEFYLQTKSKSLLPKYQEPPNS